MTPEGPVDPGPARPAAALTLDAHVAALAAAVAELRADLDELTADDQPLHVARPWNWRALTPSQRTQAWTALTDWVSWLIHRYRLDETIPGCWPAHPALVEELSALHWSWRAAYTDPTARATDPLSWHDQLDRSRARIRDWDRTHCAGGTHTADPTQDYPAASLAAGSAAIHADTHTRP